MTTDWVDWHRHYESPNSSLTRRLRVVQRNLRRALDDTTADAGGVRRLLSICAGDGRDVLPVLAEHDRGRSVQALLIELDPTLSQRARDAAAERDLPGVEVQTSDAGATETYQRLEPAHIVMACGVFGNVIVDDVRRTIAALPGLLVPNGIVIWTRGHDADGPDPSLAIRTYFAENGFTEISFTCPTDDKFRVGMHRFVSRPDPAPSLNPGSRLFTFIARRTGSDRS